ncbi:cytochrome P450 [Vararia minispora EC-137]|uniref:Cytochrome P450 n=1 Tax=Vararia minispora EC-137 TaxID=1314806 RepID=A0ACB8QNS6_9AGAM|nr:cytochrome P450 [Vararia minispora EC-137]
MQIRAQLEDHLPSFQLDNIPTVGYSYPFLSYISAVKFLTSGHKMIEEGYRKYRTNPGVFKVPTMDGWLIIAAGKSYIEDVRKAPDEVLSFTASVARSIQIRYTLGPEIETNHYHVPIVRSQLTRNLGVLFDDIRDEVVSAFNDVIPVKDDGSWVTVKTQETIQQIVCRTSNRLFIGLPLCRNKDYIKLNVEFTIDVVLGGRLLRLFPDFMKPLVGHVLTKVPLQIRRALKHLEPLIKERYRLMEEHGENWEDKPNDMLQWLMDNAEGEEKSVRNLAQRILTVNFAAIHTSSLSMTEAIYYLAAHPECADVLREEVETIVAVYGWSKASLGKMRKLDSFIKEAERLEGLGALTMGRYTLQPFTFSNGLTIPAGEDVSCVSRDIHLDEESYTDPEVFDPWRFANMRDEDGEGTKHQLVATSMEFLTFGHGRHACPGRFFAANELKTMLAHIVLNYDIKFEDGAGKPPIRYIASTCVPANVNLCFRKRSAKAA